MPPLTLPSCLHAAAERHALQVALQRVVPLVVRAGEAPCGCRGARGRTPCRGARRRSRRRGCAPSLVAHQDHRALADRGALEVARVRDLGLEADVAPVARGRRSAELDAVQLVAGVARERDPAGSGVSEAISRARTGGTTARSMASSTFRSGRAEGEPAHHKASTGPDGSRSPCPATRRAPGSLAGSSVNASGASAPRSTASACAVDGDVITGLLKRSARRCRGAGGRNDRSTCGWRASTRPGRGRRAAGRSRPCARSGCVKRRMVHGDDRRRVRHRGQRRVEIGELRASIRRGSRWRPTCRERPGAGRRERRRNAIARARRAGSRGPGMRRAGRRGCRGCRAAGRPGLASGASSERRCRATAPASPDRPGRR